MRIAVASGKGGTGKTTVAVSLALWAARQGLRTRLCDCDVEEPNARLHLRVREEGRREVTLDIPDVDPERCTHCGRCAEFCRYNALACLPDRTRVFEDLCHACGGCALVCPEGAIGWKPRSLGELSWGRDEELRFSEGELRVGETVVPPLIAAVRSSARAEDWVILDSPPGATCPVVETLRGVDYVILVTEPTPFGLHDLQAVVSLTRVLGLEAGVVINRSLGHEDIIERYCDRAGLQILTRIPFRRQVVAAASRGRSALDADERVAAAIEELGHRLRRGEVAA